MIIEIRNPDYSSEPKTRLSNIMYSGVTNISVYNTFGFTNSGTYLIFEEIGNEKAEIKYMSVSGISSSSNSFTLAEPLDFTHLQDAFVINSTYNKIKIYKATSSSAEPANGDYSLLKTVDVGVDTPNTYADVGTATIYDYFKFTYFNSTNNLETELADSPVVQKDRNDVIKTVRLLLRDFKDSHGVTKFTDYEISDYVGFALRLLKARNIMSEYTWSDGDITPSLADKYIAILAFQTKILMMPEKKSFSFRDGEKFWSESMADKTSDDALLEILISNVDAGSMMTGIDIYNVQRTTDSLQTLVYGSETYNTLRNQ